MSTDLLPDGYTPSCALPENYEPVESEEFMNEFQREFFRQKLLVWRQNLLKESNMTIENLKENNTPEPDSSDRASSEVERALELRSRDRYRKLINKINNALMSIEDGTYGYCEETGDPISLKRLIARPVATLSIDAQERHERREKVFRDD